MAQFPDNADRTFQSGDKLVGHNGSNDFNYPFSSLLDNYTTADLTEGANLYYTDERVDDRVNALITAGTYLDKSYNDGANTLTLNVNLTTVTTSDISESGTKNEKNQYALYNSGTIAHADILTLNSVPVTIINGEPGFIYTPVALFLSFDTPNTTGYTSNNILVKEQDSGATIGTIDSGLITASSGRVFCLPFSTGFLQTAFGSDIVLQADTADPTGGDANNTLKWHIKYYREDLA